MYIDLQINGYGGIDFNQDSMTEAECQTACELLAKHQTEGILATIITAPLEQMKLRISKIVAYCESNPIIRKMVKGIHVEGPFISPVAGYVGAHPKHAVRQATIPQMVELLVAGKGLIKLVTLAPEHDPDYEVIRFLSKQNIIVSAGHTDASLEILRGAVNAGLSMFTHLGNGCPQLMHRHDNIIQRALYFSSDLWFGLIADGAHIPFFTMNNYMELIGLERCFIVTDAISAAGCGPGNYPLGERTVNIGEDGVAWSEDRTHFVGSASTMPMMVNNLKQHLKLSDGEIHQLTHDNPARILGL